MTPTQRLASHLLGHDVGAYIRYRREIGRSWRMLARDIYEATDHEVDVSHETIRAWAKPAPDEDAA